MADEIIPTPEGGQDPAEVEKDPKFRGSFTTGEPPEPGEPGQGEPTGGQQELNPAEPKTGSQEPAPAGQPIDVLIKRIREAAGLEVKSEDEIIAEIKSARDLKSKFEETNQALNSLDPLAKDIDRAVKAGMDVEQYLEARKMDPEKMSDAEALKRAYMLRNQKLVSTDAKFAEKKFELEQKAKYGVLYEDMTDEERQQRAEEIDFATRSQKIDAIEAKEFLAEYKRKNITIEDRSSADAAKRQEFVDKYYTRSEAFVNELESLDVPVDNGVFKLGVDEFSGEIREDLKNPIVTLKKMGVDLETMSIDADLLGETLVKLKALDSIGPKLSKWAAEQKAAEIIGRAAGTPPPPQSLAGGALPEKDHDLKVAEAIEAQRQARRQGR